MLDDAELPREQLSPPLDERRDLDAVVEREREVDVRPLVATPGAERAGQRSRDDPVVGPRKLDETSVHALAFDRLEQSGGGGIALVVQRSPELQQPLPVERA